MRDGEALRIKSPDPRRSTQLPRGVAAALVDLGVGGSGLPMLSGAPLPGAADGVLLVSDPDGAGGIANRQAFVKTFGKVCARLEAVADVRFDKNTFKTGYLLVPGISLNTSAATCIDTTLRPFNLTAPEGRSRQTALLTAFGADPVWKAMLGLSAEELRAEFGVDLEINLKWYDSSAGKKSSSLAHTDSFAFCSSRPGSVAGGAAPRMAPRAPPAPATASSS